MNERAERASGPAPIFTPDPSVVAGSQLTAFTRFVEAETGRRFADYGALHAFSTAELRTFWALYLRFSGLLVEGEPEPVCEGDECERARFFPGLRLGYVENLLRELGPGDGDRPAITALDETGATARLTRGALRREVMRAAAGLRALGVEPGERVVAVARNDAEAAIACLGALAVGAAWSAVTPDLATEAVLDRFAPLAPSLLVAHRGYRYQGAWRPIGDKVAAMAARLPSLRAVVWLSGRAGEEPLADAAGALPAEGALAAVDRPEHPLADLGAEAADDDLALGPATAPRFAFNHPLFILFSSGTTGPPKCIVHGAGGTLLEHHKEHVLHGDLRPGDKLYFQTSSGWMMWNWQLSALAVGAEIVLYDGSVSFPDEDSLWRRVAEERVTVLGTSPAYLGYCRDAGIVPRERFDLSSLRAIQSTGSVLSDSLYEWTRDAVGALPLQSISGGTDIIGCFVLGNPNLPVYAGESQCVGLGLDVRSLPEGERVGELVCVRPFPSRPLGLWGDGDGRRFHEAYFGQHAGVWTHGDFVELTARGTARIHGRSDGVLNIRGIRIGPAELYSALDTISVVAEAMAVEQAAPREPGGSRLVLLLVLKPGATLDRALTLRIKKELSVRRSMAHVPSVVAQVDELPTTHNGKRSERAARDALNGRPVANQAALRNPGCLDLLRTHPLLQVDPA